MRCVFSVLSNNTRTQFHTVTINCQNTHFNMQIKQCKHLVCATRNMLCSLTQAYTCTTHIRMNSYDATRISQTRVGSSDIYVHAPSILYNTTLCIFKDLNSETHKKHIFWGCVFLIFLGNFATEYEKPFPDPRRPLFLVQGVVDPPCQLSRHAVGC